MRNTIRCLLAALALTGGAHITAAWAMEGESGTSPAAATQEWEMQQGESLHSLAALFYPRNRDMQQRFVAATQALNREQLGNLGADHKFEQPTALRIPELRALSAKARPHHVVKARHRAAAPRKQEIVAMPESTAAGAASSVDMATVDAMEKRNQERRSKLDDLQSRMKSLEEQSRAIQQDLAKRTPAVSGQPAPAEPVPAETAPKPRKRVVAQ